MNKSAHNRRLFLKASFAATVLGALRPGRILGALLGDGGQPGETTQGLFPVKISLNPALKNDYGSVRITVPQVPSVGGLRVTRLPGPKFVTVSERCTHAGTTINAFNASSKQFLCPSHFSTFQADGTRISGVAPRNLPSYVTTFDGNDTVFVEIAGVGVTEHPPASPDLTVVFPNPTASAATVEYSLAVQTHVAITIVGASGDMVLRIAEGVRAAGTHREVLDLSTLPAGAYFCNLVTATGEQCVRSIHVTR